MVKQRESGALTHPELTCEVGGQKDAVPGLRDRGGSTKDMGGPARRAGVPVWGSERTTVVEQRGVVPLTHPEMTCQTTGKKNLMLAR